MIGLATGGALRWAGFLVLCLALALVMIVGAVMPTRQMYARKLMAAMPNMFEHPPDHKRRRKRLT